MPIQIAKEVSAPLFRNSIVDRAAKAVRLEVGFPKGFSVSLVVVDRPTMRSLNKRYRDIDAETDVLSFRYSDDVAEIAICYPYALEQAKRKQITPGYEFSWLITHGLLHVLGYDHETASDAKIMRPLERIILNRVWNTV